MIFWRADKSGGMHRAIQSCACVDYQGAERETASATKKLDACTHAVFLAATHHTHQAP